MRWNVASQPLQSFYGYHMQHIPLWLTISKPFYIFKRVIHDKFSKSCDINYQYDSDLGNTEDT